MYDTKPTMQQYGGFQKAYDYFNETLFNSELSPCILTFNKKNKKTMGYFSANKWITKEQKTHEICLCRDFLDAPLKEIFSTLVHEMCHQWQQEFGKPSRSGYHNTQWADKMEEVGLKSIEVSKEGIPTGNRIGQSCSDEIIENGPFIKAFEIMPEEIQIPWKVIPDLTAKKAKTNKIKYVCGCNNKVWGKPKLEIVCVKCSKQFAAEAELFGKRKM